MNKTSVASIMRRRYDQVRNLFQEVGEKVEINRNLYRGYMESNGEWEYSLVDPHVFPLVRNYMSRSNPAMNTLRLDVRRPEQYEVRDVNQQLLNWEIGEIMMTTLYYRMYFSSYVAGRGYAKTGWKYQKAVEIQEKDEKGDVVRLKVLKDILNRPHAEFVRFNDLLVPNRNNPNLDQQPYVVELIQQRVGDLLDENESLEERGEKPYWDKKFLKKIKDSGVTGELLDYQMELSDDGDSKSDLAFRSAYVPLMCMHTLEGDVFYMPIKGDETIINNDHTNRYWHGHYPYVDFCPFPEDDEFFSLALVDVVGDMQIAATEVLNQTLTNIRQINTDMWIAGSAAAQTPDWQFRKRPDGVIKVMGDVSQVQQIRTQDNTRAALLVSDSLQSKIERAGGISSLYASGAPSQNINQTARGAQIIDQNIETNMKMIIDLFGEQVLKRMGEHFLELNAQYITEEQLFAVTGRRGMKELVSITPDQVDANFIVSVNTDKIAKQTPASRQVAIQNTITVLQGIEAQAKGAIQIDLIPPIEAMIDATPEMENVGDIVVSIDEKAKRDISMLERGELPEIKIRDAHEDLIMAVNVHFSNVEMLPPEIQQILEKYVEKHLQYIQAHQEMMAMTQPTMPQPGNPAQLMDAPPENMGEQEGLPNPTYNLGQIT